MLLTGKCKEDFLNHLSNTEKCFIEKGVLKIHWQEFPDLYLNALIIEWFDNVGIFILITCKNEKSFGFEVHELKLYFYEESFDFLNRKEATEKAIIKANEIYNNLNK